MFSNFLTYLVTNTNTEDTLDKVMVNVNSTAEKLKNTDISEMEKTMPAFFSKVIEFAQNAAINIVISILIFLIGKKLIKMLLRFLDRLFEKSHMETSICKFLYSLIRTISYIILFLTILQTLGIEVAGVTAIVGSAGLTIGLGLQGSLQNFAGGVLILLLKPFVIGDYVIVDGYEGTVETIDIFYTKLLTIDNRMIVMPNGTLSNTNITNVTKEEYRRLDLTVGISYSQDIKQVKELLEQIAASKEFVLKDHENVVYVDSFADSAVVMGVRVWCRTENYWPLRWDMLETIKNRFDEENITIPFNQLEVNITGYPVSLRKE